MARILVVASRHEDGAALRDLFAEDGHTAELVADANDVRSTVDTFLPDFVVADVKLPEADGKQLLTRFEGARLRPRLILVCPRDLPCAPQAPVVCLRKPIDFGRLRTLVARSGLDESDAA